MAECLDLLVPPSPIIRTVLRPNRLESASRPHSMAVKNCAAVKLALQPYHRQVSRRAFGDRMHEELYCRMPAWLEMTESGESGLNHFNI